MYIDTISARIKPFLPYIFWGLIVVVTQLLLTEHIDTPPIFPHMDKIVHVLLFGALTLIGSLAYPNYLKWLCVGLIVYGAATEVMQDLVTTTRYASIYDWLADVTGILIVTLVIKALAGSTSIKTPYVN